MKSTSKTMQTSGQTNQPIIFFGTEDFSLSSLRSLVDARFNIVAVVTKPDSRKGRGQKIIEPSVKTFAKEHGIAVWQPNKLTDIIPKLKELDNPAGVLVSYGKIIPQQVIDMFKPGIINVHPSLLPKYRGPSPIESAIKNGDSETGVSIMQLTAKMDAGPVYGYTPFALTGQETAPELYQELGLIGARTLVELLPGILSGETTPLPQDDSQASYCNLLSKSDAFIDTSSQTATEAERSVRAHLIFPKTKVQVLGKEVIILESHVANTQESPIDIVFYDGSTLRIDKLIAPSGKIMDGQAFLRGYSAG